ncbi:MAG: DUF2085 domain-containing protein [Candidatus Aminicenantes bacterium]|nr:DUF2085 domain-containing protein [Candidatus Aminicenantes bacterium]
MKRKNKILLVYSITVTGISFLLILVFLAPFLKSQYPTFSALIYTAFAPFCHQVPSRCFRVFGHPLAVCTRCLGIYFGFLAGSLFYPFARGLKELPIPKTRTFFIFTIPIVLDASINFFALWGTGGWIRFGSGFIWGTILPFYFISGISESIIRKFFVKGLKENNYFKLRGEYKIELKSEL